MIRRIVLHACDEQLNPSCKNCRHFVFNWYSKPFCAIGRNIYGYCFDNEKRTTTKEWFLTGLFRIKVVDDDPIVL